MTGMKQQGPCKEHVGRGHRGKGVEACRIASKRARMRMQQEETPTEEACRRGRGGGDKGSKLDDRKQCTQQCTQPRKKARRCRWMSCKHTAAGANRQVPWLCLFHHITPGRTCLAMGPTSKHLTVLVRASQRTQHQMAGCNQYDERLQRNSFCVSAFPSTWCKEPAWP